MMVEGWAASQFLSLSQMARSAGLTFWLNRQSRECTGAFGL
jgi:hypothetical protein